MSDWSDERIHGNIDANQFAESPDEAFIREVLTRSLKEGIEQPRSGREHRHRNQARGKMMRARIWPMKPSDAEVDGIESRFPAGTRSGEGSQSLHVFLESARKARLPAGLPLPAHQRRHERSRNE